MSFMYHYSDPKAYPKDLERKGIGRDERTALIAILCRDAFAGTISREQASRPNSRR
jgi:hypothetical protein